MNAVPTNVVEFTLPKKPRVKQKDAPPDQRKLAVIPIRAGKDERLHGATLRCLIVLCSYCNRAGLTWVSQKKVAEDLKVSRQAVTKQMALLRNYGYVEIARRGFKGERNNTLRVIFDESVSMDDAISLTSAIEDTRPPIVIKEQERQMEEVNREGQQRIAKMVAGALKQQGKPKERTMPKEGQTMTVTKMKEDIAKAKSKRSVKQPLEVANGSNPQVAIQGVDNIAHRQPLGVATEATSEGSAEHTKNGTKELIKVNKVKEDLINKTISKTVLSNLEVEELKAQGLTDAKIAEALDVLLPAYRAEGLTPTSRLLADSILQLSRDVR